jgi:hypothetical protein
VRNALFLIVSVSACSSLRTAAPDAGSGGEMVDLSATAPADLGSRDASVDLFVPVNKDGPGSDLLAVMDLAQGVACNVDCGMAPEGHRCFADGGDRCGCAVATDCPVGNACETTMNRCDSTCNDGVHTDCNSGCCYSRSCVAGTGNFQCGMLGTACVNCANDPAGNQCINFACGCNADGDCPNGKTCKQHKCL